jgi:general secretion pathway protein K
MNPCGPNSQRGGALLAVLWLSAALSAIAFSVATTVRGETERASTLSGGIRSYYIATGGIDRALMHLSFGPQGGGGGGDGRSNSKYQAAPAWMQFDFPAGAAAVEVIPESAKLSINDGTPQDFMGLLTAIGVEPDRAREIALAIVDWRSPGAGGAFDAFYSTFQPSFRARHASFEEIEEVLFVKGMTPEIFYGTYSRDANGRLFRHSAFRDCVSVYGAANNFDVNSAEPGLLAWLGMPPDAIARLVEFRRARRITNLGDLAKIGVPVVRRLGIGANTIFTLRSTARHRLDDGTLSDVRRSVSALVKFPGPEQMLDEPFLILRWNDTAAPGVMQ